jgi:hypothetical protein
VPRVIVSARRNTRTPLGQPNDWGPGGLRRFLILFGMSLAVAGFFIWLTMYR